MLRRHVCPAVVLLALAVLPLPGDAQVISVEGQPMSFPVLAGAHYRIDPDENTSDRLFRLDGRALQLRTTDAGFIDMAAYCRLPERYWGPVSMVHCSLEVSGQPPRVGLALPARVSLAGLPMGTTVTLRMLLQAHRIVLDLQGNPSAVLDTFVEEYRWTLAGRPLPVVSQTIGRNKLR